MPWFAVNAMSEDDLKAIYHFVKSLGDPGLPAPVYIPPNGDVKGPYVSFPAPPPNS